jgi:hypothetical protein
MMTVLVLTLGAPARAAVLVEATQSDASATTADIQRLQDRVYSLSGDVSRLRSRDNALASRLEGDLDDLRDEVIYLKVKLRKEGRVPRTEYADLRDRLDNLGARARGESTSSSTSGGSSSTVSARPVEPDTRGSGSSSSSSAGAVAPDSRGTAAGYGTSGTVSADPTVADQNRARDSRSEPRHSSRDREVPVGQELDIRLQTPLNSNTAQVEDRFEATTLVDLIQGDDVIVPAGAVLRGVVSSVKPAGRVERKGSMTLSFDQMTVRGRDYPIRATVTQAIESSGVRGEAGKIGTGAGVGAIIGGILGGFKGAMAGILIGGGGTVAATEGNDVKLDAGTILRIRFDAPVQVESAAYRR